MHKKIVRAVLMTSLTLGVASGLFVGPSYAQGTKIAVESLTVYVDGATCPRDSGEPLLTTAGALLGVASWRTQGACGTGLSAFTRVEPRAAWVQDIRGRRRVDR